MREDNPCDKQICVFLYSLVRESRWIAYLELLLELLDLGLEGTLLLARAVEPLLQLRELRFEFVALAARRVALQIRPLLRRREIASLEVITMSNDGGDQCDRSVVPWLRPSS